MIYSSVNSKEKIFVPKFKPGDLIVIKNDQPFGVVYGNTGRRCGMAKVLEGEILLVVKEEAKIKQDTWCAHLVVLRADQFIEFHSHSIIETMDKWFMLVPKKVFKAAKNE